MTSTLANTTREQREFEAGRAARSYEKAVRAALRADGLKGPSSKYELYELEDVARDLVWDALAHYRDEDDRLEMTDLIVGEVICLIEHSDSI